MVEKINYHISPYTLAVNVCHANKVPCPFKDEKIVQKAGGPLHFGSYEAARKNTSRVAKSMGMREFRVESVKDRAKSGLSVTETFFAYDKVLSQLDDGKMPNAVDGYFDFGLEAGVEDFGPHGEIYSAEDVPYIKPDGVKRFHAYEIAKLGGETNVPRELSDFVYDAIAANEGDYKVDDYELSSDGEVLWARVKSEKVDRAIRFFVEREKAKYLLRFPAVTGLNTYVQHYHATVSEKIYQSHPRLAHKWESAFAGETVDINRRALDEIADSVRKSKDESLYSEMLSLSKLINKG